MAHTNSTANLELPQFIGSDKPTWLGDINGAFQAIDAYAGTNDAAVAAVDAKADNAVADAASAVTTATAASNTAGTASTTATNANTLATQALTAANNADTLASQVNARVGSFTDLHTTAKNTAVAAINEVKDAEGDLSNLATTNKTNLVAAINEVAQGGGGGGSTLIATVTADGTKTYSQLLDELGAHLSDVTTNSYVVIDQGSTNKTRFTLSQISSSEIRFSQTIVTASICESTGIALKASGSAYRYFNGTSVSDYSSSVPTSGYIIKLYA